MKKYLSVLILLIGQIIFSQTQLKLMSYNLLDFPEAIPNPRENYLKNILDNIKPDVFMVCELETEAGANLILNTSLATSDNRYARANFVINQSGSYPGDIQQLVFYNTQKLNLTGQSEIITTVRDINHYNFTLKTVNMNINPIYLDVFVAHLKSSTGTSNKNKRRDMVLDFTSALASVPNSHFVVIGGDFNLYSNTEPAYQELLDTTNAIVLVDPLNRPGNWHNNSNFEDIHTQSTHTYTFYNDGAGNYYGAGGGLDDRFDFILMSKNLETSTDLHYVSGTYKSYGNNGNCFNKRINDISCTGIFSQETRDNLYNMSDHLPVIMELETPENTLGIEKQQLIKPIVFTRGNLINKWLEMTSTLNLAGSRLTIYNQLGQNIFSRILSQSNKIKYNLSNLTPGVYYIKIGLPNFINPLKFVKLP